VKQGHTDDCFLNLNITPLASGYLNCPKPLRFGFRHLSDAETERLFRASPTELMRQPQDTGQLDIDSVTGRLRWILVEILRKAE